MECSLHMAICLLAASKSFLSIQLAKRTHLLAHPWGSRGRHLGLDGNAGLVKDLGSGGPAGAYGPDGAGGLGPDGPGGLAGPCSNILGWYTVGTTN